MTSIRTLSLLGLGALVALSLSNLGCGDSATGSGGGNTSSGGGGPGAGGAGGNAGGGGGSVTPVPFGTKDGQWTFVPISGAKCMDNSDTGIGVNTNASSQDVIVYLEGGNACFNQISCSITANPHGYTKATFDGSDAGSLATTPIFDRSSSLLKDYNYVYVPYCTGDTHSGDAEGMIGGEMRYFHGAHNMDLYLARVHAAFPNAKNVIISGSSAGGFGAAFNYDRVAKVFPNVKVMLLDDSGPPMGVVYVSTCLQKFFMDTWGLDKTLPADCPDCTPSTGVFMEPLVKYIAKTYPDRRLALVSSSEDATISRFWGYGEKQDGTEDCSTLGGLPAPYDGTRYAAGLEDLRDRIVGNEKNFKMFLIDSTQANGDDNTHHVWLDHDPTTVVSNGVKLSTWLDQMLSGSGAWANVPTTGE